MQLIKEAADGPEETSPALGLGAALGFPFVDSSLDEAGPIIDRPKAEGATT